jgi:hypothetical protein
MLQCTVCGYRSPVEFERALLRLQPNIAAPPAVGQLSLRGLYEGEPRQPSRALARCLTALVDAALMSMTARPSTPSDEAPAYGSELDCAE